MIITQEVLMAAVSDAYRAGVEIERERAIKIIKGHHPPCECSFILVCYPHRLIALIKGEK